MSKRLNIRLLGPEAEGFSDILPEHCVTTLSSHEKVGRDVDFVFCLSYPKIIPDGWLKIPRVGFFVCHSSDLPMGRGWAPLQWSVLKGFSKIVVTFFRAAPGVDTGNWCYKGEYPILRSDIIADLYAKDRQLTRSFMERAVTDYLAGNIKFYPQQGKVTHWPRRTPKDSQVDPNWSLPEAWDLLRVCDNDDYPAFFSHEDGLIQLKLCPLSEGVDAPELDDLASESLLEIWRRVGHGNRLSFQVDKRLFGLEFFCAE
jgi:methionyl-tRNA formyltransferase